MKKVLVKCLECLQDVEMPLVEGIRYTLWPVIHTPHCPKEVYTKVEQT